MSTFVAIDFETATTRRDSACAVGLAAGCDGRVILTRTYLIRPPTGPVYVHRPTRPGLGGRARCANLRPSCGRRFAPGSTTRRSSPPTTRRSTGASCTRVAPGTGCARRGRRSPAPCSSPARSGESGQRSCPTSARRLRIPLRHHAAGADALACARIVLAAEADGWLPGRRRTYRTATRAMVRLAPPVGRARSTSLLRWPAFVRLLQTWWQRLWPRTSQHAETPELEVGGVGSTGLVRRCHPPDSLG